MGRDAWLALTVLAACLVIAFVWIPLDTDTGIVEKARRRLEIGDALAPMVAATVVAIGAVLLLVESRGSATPQPALRVANLVHLAWLGALAAASLLAMRWSGPLAVAWLGPEGVEYRLLRDTPPWKYVGFVAGGTFLVAGLVARVERRLRWTALALALAAVLALVLLYDLPFDDLLLPPNGDV